MVLGENNIVHVKVILGKEKESQVEFIEDSTGRKEFLRFEWRDDLSYHFGVYLYDEGDSAEILNNRI